MIKLGLKLNPIYTIKPYQPSYAKVWNAFVSQAINATFLFDRQFMDYHQHRFTDASLLVFKNDKLIALLPANKSEDTIYSHNGLSYGGLLISEQLKLSEVCLAFGAILKYYHDNGIQSLTIKETPTIYYSQPCDFLAYLSYILKGKMIKTEILSVIDNTSVAIKPSKLRLRGIKKAEKHELVIKEENDLTSFFETVLVPNLAREHNQKPVHSTEEIMNLKLKFPNNIRQFNVYHNNTLVAGTTLFETKHVAHAQYIGSLENRQEFGSLDFLFHHLINEVYKTKPFFDFGTSNENNGLQVNEGLLYFKESFGARTISQQTFKFNTANYNLLDTVFI